LTKKTGEVRGRPPGRAAIGSGNHEVDAMWRAKGYVTLTEAAAALGLAKKTLYKMVYDGRLAEGKDYVKAWAGRNGPVYVKQTTVDRLKPKPFPGPPAAL
jgi:hypothetical protein